MDCPALLPPAHGYFLRNECKNVFNAACGVRCHSGYQVDPSLTHVKLHSSCPALASGCVSPPVHGVGSRPSARLKLAAPCSRPPTATSPAPPTTMKLTPPASLGRPPFHTKSISRCNFGYRLLGSRKRLCLPISLWGGLPAYCKCEDRSPSLISFHSDQVSPTEEAKLWRHLSTKVLNQEVCFWRPVRVCM